MAITTERVIGSQVASIMVIDTEDVTDWQDVTLRFMERTEDSDAADTEYSEVVAIKKWVEGTAKVFMGAANNGGTLPKAGDAITISPKIGTDSLIPSLTEYGTIKVMGPVEYNFVADLAGCSFAFRSGRKN